MAKQKNAKTKKDKKAWLTYEEVIAKAYTAFYKVLEPSFVVKHNDFIYGKNSETERQIDVSIRGKSENDKEFLAIVSAKDYRSKISIPKIDELYGSMQDVGATKAIMLCNGGFTKQTKVYARNLGIDLCTLNHLAEIQKDEILTVPVIFVKFIDLDVNFKFHIVIDEGLSLKGKAAFEKRTYADDNNFFDSMNTMFLWYWNNNKLSKTAGKHEATIEPFFVVVEGYKSPQQPIQVVYEVFKKGIVEFVPLTEYFKLTHQTREEALVHLEMEVHLRMNFQDWPKLTAADEKSGTYPGLHLEFAYDEYMKEEYIKSAQEKLLEN